MSEDGRISWSWVDDSLDSYEYRIEKVLLMGLSRFLHGTGGETLESLVHRRRIRKIQVSWVSLKSRIRRIRSRTISIVLDVDGIGIWGTLIPKGCLCLYSCVLFYVHALSQTQRCGYPSSFGILKSFVRVTRLELYHIL